MKQFSIEKNKKKKKKSGELHFLKMKSALKRLFIPTPSVAESLNIKQEEAFYDKKLQYKR